MRTAWGLWAMLLVSSLPAAASAVLYPEPSAWGALQTGGTLDDRNAEASFMAKIAAAIPDAFGPQVRLRLIIEEVGHGPDVIGLKQTEKGYRIIAAQPGAWLKLDPKVQVSRCEVAVAPPIGEAIVADWKSVLLATSYAEKPAFGGDGDIDHFAMSLEGRWLAGWAYEPASATPPGRLDAIAMAMMALCMRDEPQEHQRLQSVLSDFAKP